MLGFISDLERNEYRQILLRNDTITWLRHEHRRGPPRTTLGTVCWEFRHRRGEEYGEESCLSSPIAPLAPRYWGTDHSSTPIWEELHLAVSVDKDGMEMDFDSKFLMNRGRRTAFE